MRCLWWWFIEIYMYYIHVRTYTIRWINFSSFRCQIRSCLIELDGPLPLFLPLLLHGDWFPHALLLNLPLSLNLPLPLPLAVISGLEDLFDAPASGDLDAIVARYLPKMINTYICIVKVTKNACIVSTVSIFMIYEDIKMWCFFNAVKSFKILA